MKNKTLKSLLVVAFMVGAAAMTSCGQTNPSDSPSQPSTSVSESTASQLDAYKANAKTEVENYKSADDYRDAEKTQLATLVNNAKSAIDAANDTASVDTAVNAFKAAADALKTAAQYEEEEAQALLEAIANAKTEIETYVDPINYRTAEANMIYDLIDEYEAKVDEADSIASVESLVAQFKAAVDLLPVDTGFTGTLDKGAKVSFIHTDTDSVSDLLIRPQVKDWTGDGFAIRIKNTSTANMFISVYLNETDSDRVALATGASYYLYHANGTKTMETSGRGWGNYINVPFEFDGYVYIPFTSMQLVAGFGSGNAQFNYSEVYGLYLESNTQWDSYHAYTLGELQVLNGNVISTVLSTSEFTSKNYTNSYVKDYNGENVVLEFNGEIEEESSSPFKGSLTGSEISFTATEADQLTSFRIVPQDADWSGDGFSIRIKNLTAIESPISIFVNETDSDIAVLKQGATYTLYGVDGTETEGSNNRGWGSYLMLPANFDGYVYFPYSSFEFSRTSFGDSSMNYGSIWGVYLETNTKYDAYQHFIIGSVEVKNGDTVKTVIDTSGFTADNFLTALEGAGNNENSTQVFYQEQ